MNDYQQMDPRSGRGIDTWRSCATLVEQGNDKAGTSTHQGCNVLDEGDVLVVGSEEEVVASGSQDAQQQRSEHHWIQWEIWGCRVDIGKEHGVKAVGDQVSAQDTRSLLDTARAHLGRGKDTASVGRMIWNANGGECPTREMVPGLNRPKWVKGWRHLETHLSGDI